MDDLTLDMLAGMATAKKGADADDVHSEPDTSSPARVKRRGLRGLLSKASVQDQLLEK
jgi:hypothetical protein